MRKDSRPKWVNLTMSLCPLCAARLSIIGLLEPMYECSRRASKECDFSINHLTYDTIMGDRGKKKDRVEARGTGRFDDPEDAEIARFSYYSR